MGIDAWAHLAYGVHCPEGAGEEFDGGRDALYDFIDEHELEYKCYGYDGEYEIIVAFENSTSWDDDPKQIELPTHDPVWDFKLKTVCEKLQIPYEPKWWLVCEGG